MTVSTRSIAGVLRDVVGPDALVDDSAALARGAVDGLAPRWIVRATTVEQVSGVLALAWEESLAVVPRGSGSALDLGHPPSRVDLVLDLAGMNRVLDYNPDDLTASVQVGVTADALAAQVGARRQLLPVDAPAAGSRTLGGLVATAAWGPLRARYGTLRDLLLGVRFVQADGVVTWGGARVVKSVTGYDVPKLMVGALGTLGVLCELTLRLHPRPEAEGTRLVTFDAVEGAAAFVARVLDSSLEPNRLELLDGTALSRLGGERAACGLAISVGSVQAAVRSETATIDAFARDAGAASTPAADDFWPRYAAMAVAAGRALTLQVASVPSRLVATLRAVRDALVPLPSDSAVVAGCAALGTLEVMLPAAAVPDAARIVARMRDGVGQLGGHVIVRRAPVEVRRQIDPWGPVDPEVMALMKGLRDEFDPRRVLNPGRFVGGL